MQLHQQILSEIEVSHGPAEMLGRFFLKAVSAANARGVRLRFGTFDELSEVNRQNAKVWRPLVPTFDSQTSYLVPENAFCLLGEDLKGDVVASSAAKIFDWTSSNLNAEASSLRIFYADPTAALARNEQCRMSTPSAATISGHVLHTGAVWYRPDYRGRGLVAIMPRFARAYAAAKWTFDTVVSLQPQIRVRGSGSRAVFDAF